MSALDGLKICFLAGTLGQGGAERQLFYQLRTLTRCNAKPAVICFSNQGYWQERIDTLGIPVFGIGQAHSRFDRIRQTLTIVRQLTPDIVQSVHFFTNLYSVFVARSLGVKEIGAVRGDGIRDVVETGILGGWLSLHLPRFLAANSKNAIRNIVHMGCKPSKLRYLPNVVDTQSFVPRSQFGRAAFHILMVGRLVESKRFDVFLHLLSSLNQQTALKVVGHIVGNGPNLEKLQCLARQLGLKPDQIYFHGAVTDVEKLYHIADVCFHLSDWEGLPNTVMEAMACGLPIIASRVGGVAEIVENGQTGYLVDSGDDPSLLDRVNKLMMDADLRIRMGNSARDFIIQHHALYNLPNTLIRFYEKILQ